MVLQIVDLNLDPYSSRFWCELGDRDRITVDQYLLAHLFEAATGQPHDLVTARERRRKRAAFEEKKARILANEKRRKRLLAARTT